MAQSLKKKRLLGLSANTGGGVARYRVFDGILYQLLEGSDGAPLQGADGFYLYGVA